MGAELQVRKRSGGWTLLWVLDHRPLLGLSEGPQGVWAEIALTDREVALVVQDQRTDPDFRSRVMEISPTHGRRKVRVRVDTPRRVSTLSIVLRCKAYGHAA
jgi:hypothetical protein